MFSYPYLIGEETEAQIQVCVINTDPGLKPRQSRPGLNPGDRMDQGGYPIWTGFTPNTPWALNTASFQIQQRKISRIPKKTPGTKDFFFFFSAFVKQPPKALTPLGTKVAPGKFFFLSSVGTTPNASKMDLLSRNRQELVGIKSSCFPQGVAGLPWLLLGQCRKAFKNSFLL